MRFRPCIDLHQGSVKQIVGSTLNDTARHLVENYVAPENAAYFAELFKRDGLSGGHVIMLGPGNEVQALKALEAFPGGLQVGGGITADNAAHYLGHGASHVIVTSYVFREGVICYQNLKRIVAEIGKERLVLDLSCRARDGAYFVATDKWRKFTDFEVNAENLQQLSQYCAEFLIHAVDVEGLRQGMNLDLVEKLGGWVTIPTTYAGGIRSLADIDLIAKLGAGKLDFTIGSALDIFGGSLFYRDVIEWQRKTMKQ
jgi:phosphoribosylformimino-5-aminoimidazole carboxamide ribotide isomerase, eukaryotic type